MEIESLQKDNAQMLDQLYKLRSVVAGLLAVNAHITRRLQDEATLRYQEVEEVKRVWIR